MFMNGDEIGRPFCHFVSLPNELAALRRRTLNTRILSSPCPRSYIASFHIEFREGIIAQESGDRW